jgi:hypothetical protein
MAYNIQINLQEFRDFVDNPNGGEEELQIIVEGYLDNGRHLGTFDNVDGAVAVLNNYIATNELNHADYQDIIEEIQGQDYMFELPLVPEPVIAPAALPLPVPLPQVPEQPEVPDVTPAAGGSRNRRRKRRRKRSKRRKTSKGGSRRVQKRSNRKGRNPKSRKFRKTRRPRKTRRTRRTQRTRKRR